MEKEALVFLGEYGVDVFMRKGIKTELCFDADYALGEVLNNVNHCGGCFFNMIS